MEIIIGLTGRRGVGKSMIAAHLQARHGFLAVHPFAGGKAACRGYFVHLGADPQTALRMTDGDLRDRPSELLPRMADGRHATPRFFMEKLGAFMAGSLGVDWTLGLEIARARRQHPGRHLVVESVVYESDIIREAGGFCVEIRRPGVTIVGPETDRAGAGIVPDMVFRNDGTSVSAALRRFDEEILEEILRRHEPGPAP